MHSVDELLYSLSDYSLFGPESLDDVRHRLAYIDNHECKCDEGPHENAIHDLAYDDVPVLLKLIEVLAAKAGMS